MRRQGRPRGRDSPQRKQIQPRSLPQACEIINKQNTSLIKSKYWLKYLDNLEKKEKIGKKLIHIKSELIKAKIQNLLESNSEVENNNPFKF